MTRHPVLVSVLCVWLSSVVAAQRPPSSSPIDTSQQMNVKPMIESHGGATLVVSVLNEEKAHLDRQAVVKLEDETHGTSIWHATSEASETTFIDLTIGKYAVEVSAVGYVPARREISLLDLVRSTSVQVLLQRDPDAIDLDAANAPLPGKAGKETRHAISDLNSNKIKDAQKYLDAAYKLAPASPQVNFLLGYLSFQKNLHEQAQAYLEKSIVSDPQNIQGLNLLGRVYLVEGKNAEAQAVLQRAVATDAQNWMGHNLLADAYLRQHDAQNALAQADLAVQGSKAMSASAQIIRGQALANMGRDQEAVQALTTYLSSAPDSPTAPQVRDLIAQIQHHSPGSSQIAAAQTVPAAGSTENDLLLESAQLSLTLKAWAPPGIDDEKPAVAAGVVCPYQEIIDNSGASVKRFVDEISQFSAIEDLLHERLDKAGNPATRETRKFDYVASISGSLQVDEFRSGRYGINDLPDQIVTVGFPALALVFHPDMRDNFDIRCEGLGQLRGQATWLLHFQQREDRPKRLQDYRFGEDNYALSLKGRAWISADKFQIVRIESELVHPMPAIQLLAEHQITEYGAVPFPKKNVELWLPKTAEVYLAFRKHLYYRRHSFDHYMLFSVDSVEKVREAKGGHGPDSGSPRRRKYRWAWTPGFGNHAPS